MSSQTTSYVPSRNTALTSILFFFSSRRRHTRLQGDWSSDVCSSDLQPGRVGDVGLAARNLLDVASVDEQTVELVLEDRPDRLPVDAGRFHRHLRDATGLQPIAQRQQPAHAGLELCGLLPSLTATSGN